jgi:transcription elongation factor
LGGEEHTRCGVVAIGIEWHRLRRFRVVGEGGGFNVVCDGIALDKIRSARARMRSCDGERKMKAARSGIELFGR